MTNDEVVDLLSVITAYDNRNATAATVAAWTTASEIGRWSYRLAVEAAHHHFAESTEYLMPAHITQRLRQSRRADSEVFRALPGPPPASDEVRSRAMETIREYAKGFGIRDDLSSAQRPPAGSAEDEARRQAALDQLEAARADLDGLIGGGS